MKRGLTWLALLSVALAAVGFYHAKTARATPPNLFKGTTIAVGTFNEFDVFNQFSNNDLPSGFPGNVWISLQKTKGPSVLFDHTCRGVRSCGRASSSRDANEKLRRFT